jgi:hypothetical protein
MTKNQQVFQACCHKQQVYNPLLNSVFTVLQSVAAINCLLQLFLSRYILFKSRRGTKMSSFDGRYAFIADWYDPNAALTRKYQLFYYPSDSTVEMVGTNF